MEFFVAFMLLALGFVFGSLSPKSDFLAVDISSVFGIFSSIGTIFAAAIAVPALNSWRKQFKHGEKIKRLEGLRAIDGAIAALYALCDSHNEHGVCKLRGTDVSGASDKISKAQSLYFERSAEYAKSWRAAVIVMDSKEVKSCRWQPEKLHGLFLEVVTAIASISNRSQRESSVSEGTLFLELLNEYTISRMSLRDAIGEAREDVDNLIRKNL